MRSPPSSTTSSAPHPSRSRPTCAPSARLVDDVRAIDPSDPAAAEAQLRTLATPSVIQAGQSLATFAREQCGFDDVFQAGS